MSKSERVGDYMRLIDADALTSSVLKKAMRRPLMQFRLSDARTASIITMNPIAKMIYVRLNRTIIVLGQKG